MATSILYRVQIKKPKKRFQCAPGDVSGERKTGLSRPATSGLIASAKSLVRVNHNKQLTIALLNVESLKNRQHFHEISKMALKKKYDVLTISETWFNATITYISVEIKGYKIFRLDRLVKSGAGVCAYVRHGLRTWSWSSRTWLASANQVYINSGYKSKTRKGVRSRCALSTDPRT